jgi:hypothetical protein
MNVDSFPVLLSRCGYELALQSDKSLRVKRFGGCPSLAGPDQPRASRTAPKTVTPAPQEDLRYKTMKSRTALKGMLRFGRGVVIKQAGLRRRGTSGGSTGSKRSESYGLDAMGAPLPDGGSRFLSSTLNAVFVPGQCP